MISLDTSLFLRHLQNFLLQRLNDPPAVDFLYQTYVGKVGTSTLNYKEPWSSGYGKRLTFERS